MRGFGLPWAAGLALIAAAGCSGGSSDTPGDTGHAGAGGSTTGVAGGGGGGAAGGPITGVGGNYPFPQHRTSASCDLPSNANDADVVTGWDTYKKKMIVSGSGGLRVQRPENSNDTVSEGIGYGMLMAVYMADKATFDGLWAYEKGFRDGKGLMNWHISATGSVAGSGAATDADEDMAFALVMADKQWGGYSADAKAQINAILNNEVASDNTLRPDDSGTNIFNPSYFAPSYYRVFATYTSQSRWMQVVDQGYTVLNKCANATTHLVPDWCDPGSGAPNSRGTYYYYDATRTPLRIALDACWTGEARAIAYLAPLGTFFDGLGGPNAIKDGYNLDGTVNTTKGSNVVPAFLGPAGTSGMPGRLGTLMMGTYGLTAAIVKGGTASSYSYYNASVGLLSILAMSGNFVAF